MTSGTETMGTSRDTFLRQHSKSAATAPLQESIHVPA